MDEMTQNNASLADSSASAAQNLTKYADQMSKTIAVFQTSDIHIENTSDDDGEVQTKPALPAIEIAMEAAEETADKEWQEVATSIAAGSSDQMDHAVGEDWSDF